MERDPGKFGREYNQKHKEVSLTWLKRIYSLGEGIQEEKRNF